mmetsp:Transcript_14310/g.38354  ORF Transcript_14310/g.38354 Transcript_14310/m.38354 type:complete len:264 (-) Transcript_14310:377-1168(-)
MCRWSRDSAPMRHHCAEVAPAREHGGEPKWRDASGPVAELRHEACGCFDCVRQRRRGASVLDLEMVLATDSKRKERLVIKCVKRLQDANEEYRSDMFWFLRPAKVMAMFSSYNAECSPGSSCAGSVRKSERTSAVASGGSDIVHTNFVLRDSARVNDLRSNRGHIRPDEVCIILQPDVSVFTSRKRPASALCFSKARLESKTKGGVENVSTFEKVLLCFCLLTSLYLLLALSGGSSVSHGGSMGGWFGLEQSWFRKAYDAETW